VPGRNKLAIELLKNGGADKPVADREETSFFERAPVSGLRGTESNCE